MTNYSEQSNVVRFVDGGLVLARNGLNPQIRFAIGKIEGNDKPKGKVTLRLLHVLRAWSNDGHGRPDERLVQANHSGLGNYAEFLRSDVATLSNEGLPLVLQMSASELEAQLSAQGEVVSSISPATTPAEYQALVRRWAAADGTVKSSDLSDEEQAKAIAEVEAVSTAMDLSPFQIDEQGLVVDGRLSNYIEQATDTTEADRAHLRQACEHKIALHVDAAIDVVEADPVEADAWAYEAGKEAWEFDLQVPEKLASHPALSAAFKRGFDSVEQQAYSQREVPKDGDAPRPGTVLGDQAGDLLDIEVDLSGIREASSEDEVMLALPPLSAVKASAKRCLEECDVKSMERFEGFARMPPDLFLAQCERGHEHELSQRLANHYRGLSMDVKLSLFRGWVASYGGQANNGNMSNHIELPQLPDADLLAEINRRGMLQPLYGAIGAMHDHLDRTGALDERLTQYLAYRLRREEAAITGMPDSADRVANWQECIDQLDREARGEERPSM